MVHCCQYGGGNRPALRTLVLARVQVRFAQKPRDLSAPPIGPPTSNVLTEVDRRRLFFTRGPPGIQAITVNGAFSPYGEVIFS